MDLLTIIPFVMATTFSPGPNNLSAAAMSVKKGYKKTLPYICGITFGFFFLMLGCGYFSGFIMKTFPVIQKHIKWVGSGYIFYLGLKILKSQSSEINKENKEFPGFFMGMILQWINPKAIFYGVTLYTIFIPVVNQTPKLIGFYSVGFAFTTFSAVSLWAVTGSFIEKNILKSEKHRIIFQWLLFGMMIYAGLSILVS